MEIPANGHLGKDAQDWEIPSGWVRAFKEACQKLPADRNADRPIAHGRVSTRASARLRKVDIFTPEPLAAIVPATPEESTCVVETGRPETVCAR